MAKRNSGPTDPNEVRNLNQQAEANKQQASGQFGAQNTQNTEEFGAETDVQAVRQQNQQAERNKAQASGQYGQEFGQEFGQQNNQ